MKNDTTQSQESSKGIFLQFFLPFALAIGGTGTTFGAFVMLDDVFPGLQPITVVVALAVVALAAVACCILGISIFHWYNMEQAIRRTLSEDISFKDALIKNVSRSIPALTGAVIPVMGVTTRLQETTAFTIIFVICLILLVIGTAMAGVLIAKCCRWRNERRSLDQRKIYFCDEYINLPNGMKVLHPKMLTIAEVVSKYW